MTQLSPNNKVGTMSLIEYPKKFRIDQKSALMWTKTLLDLHILVNIQTPKQFHAYYLIHFKHLRLWG